MVRERSVVTAIILTFVTCGLYGIFWMISLNDDVRTLTQRRDLTSGGVVVLLTILTCGIYSLYWAYKMGKTVTEYRRDKNIYTDDSAVLYLILSLFGLGIVVYALLQTNINELVNESNKENIAQ